MHSTFSHMEEKTIPKPCLELSQNGNMLKMLRRTKALNENVKISQCTELLDIFEKKVFSKKNPRQCFKRYTFASESDNNFVRPFTRNSYGVIP